MHSVLIIVQSKKCDLIEGLVELGVVGGAGEARADVDAGVAVPGHPRVGVGLAGDVHRGAVRLAAGDVVTEVPLAGVGLGVEVEGGPAVVGGGGGQDGAGQEGHHGCGLHGVPEGGLWRLHLGAGCTARDGRWARWGCRTRAD